VIEGARDNVFCAVPKQKLFNSFLLFSERTVTGVLYLDMLEKFLMPTLEEEKEEGGGGEGE
jgi:hypothetical protein